jgi:hypothetical protein
LTAVRGSKIIYWEPHGIPAVRGARQQLREIGRRIIRASTPTTTTPTTNPARRHACAGTLMTGILSHGAPPLLDDRP